MNENDMMNLRKFNSSLGATICRLNKDYDEEDAAFLDNMMSVKVVDFGNWINQVFVKMLEDAPEELRNMTIGDVMQLVMDLNQSA